MYAYVLLLLVIKCVMLSSGEIYLGIVHIFVHSVLDKAST